MIQVAVEMNISAAIFFVRNTKKWMLSFYHVYLHETKQTSMKKVFYESFLAKILLLPRYSTITLGPFVLTKRSELSQRAKNHECTHARQWIEITVLVGLLLWIGMLIFDYSAWWMALAAAAFYVWYVIEYVFRRVIGLFKGANQTDAYKAVAFEQEARFAESDCNYLENCGYFNWINFY